MNDDIKQLGERMDEMGRDIRLIKKHLIGESEPERSLLFRVADHERQLSEIAGNKRSAVGLAWTALGTGVTAITMWAWSKLTGNHP